MPRYVSFFYTDVTDGVTPPAILELSNSNLHTNFKISSKSETLTLSDNNGVKVNELLVVGLFSDVSIGTSVVDQSIVYFKNTTPGYANSKEEFVDTITKDVIFSHNGGAVSSNVSLAISGNTDGETIRYTTDATEPTEISSIYTNPINVSSNYFKVTFLYLVV